MKIIGIVVSTVTGALLLMALAACIAVVRAGECMRAIGGISNKLAVI